MKKNYEKEKNSLIAKLKISLWNPYETLTFLLGKQ